MVLSQGECRLGAVSQCVCVCLSVYVGREQQRVHVLGGWLGDPKKRIQNAAFTRVTGYPHLGVSWLIFILFSKDGGTTFSLTIEQWL